MYYRHFVVDASGAAVVVVDRELRYEGADIEAHERIYVRGPVEDSDEENGPRIASPNEPQENQW